MYMKAAYLSMLSADDCLTFGETAFTLFRYKLFPVPRESMNGRHKKDGVTQFELLFVASHLFRCFVGMYIGGITEDKCMS